MASDTFYTLGNSFFGDCLVGMDWTFPAAGFSKEALIKSELVILPELQISRMA